MDSMDDNLRAVAERFVESPDALERVLWRVERRRRARKGAALVVGIAMGIASISGVWWAFRASPDQRAVRPAESAPIPSPVMTGGGSAYPKGAFSSCPDVGDALEPSSGDPTEAEAVAVAFNRALLDRDVATVAALADPSVVLPDDGSLAMPTTGSTSGVRVVGGGPADGDMLVAFGCGSDVAEKTFAVSLLDDSGTVSAGGVRYYLVLRSDGWRVWGSY